MNTPSEGMLAQRQLRAAEIALETARQRRRETDAELRELEIELEQTQTQLAETRAAGERDRAELEEQLRLARVRQVTAEQRQVQERNLRLNLEQQLSALRREQTRRDDLGRQLAAEARIRELEGDLELVTRHAAAFEYGVRMAAFDAFKLVRDMTDLVGGLLSRAGLVQAPDRPRPGESPVPPGSAAPRGPRATPEPPLDPADRAGAAGAAARLSAPEPPPVAERPGSPAVPEPASIVDLLPTPAPRTPDEAGPRRALDTFRRIPVPRRAVETPPDAEMDPVTGRPVEPLRTASSPPPAPTPPSPPSAEPPAEAYVPPARPRDRDAVRPPSVASVLDSHRLDAALDRLRATTPPPEDEQA